MSAYDNFLKETKSGASDGAKVVPPSVGNQKQPASPATSAYELYQRETGGAPSAPVVTPPPAPKKPSAISVAIKKTSNAVGNFFDTPENKGQVLGTDVKKNTLKYLPSSIVESLPFGIGQIFKQIHQEEAQAIADPSSYETSGIKNVTGKDLLKNTPQAVVEGAKGFVKAPIVGATDVYGAVTGKKVKFNVKGLGEITNAQYNVAKRIAEGENPVTVALEEGSNSILDTLFFASIVSKPFTGRPTVTNKASVPASDYAKTPTAVKDISPKSFRLYETKTTGARLSPEFLDKMQSQGVDLGAKFDPTRPTYFKMTFEPKTKSFVGEVVQIKPSWFDVVKSKFNGNVAKAPTQALNVIAPPKTVAEKDFKVALKNPVIEKSKPIDTAPIEQNSAYAKFATEKGITDLNKPAIEVQREIEAKTGTPTATPTPTTKETPPTVSRETTTPTEKTTTATEKTPVNTPQVEIPTFEKAQDLIQKEGGYANASSLPAVNAYASTELAGSLGLDAKYLYENATSRGIKLKEFLDRLDKTTDISARNDIAHDLITKISADIRTNPRATNEAITKKTVSDTLAGKRESFRLTEPKQLKRAVDYGVVKEGSTPETKVTIYRAGDGIKAGDHISLTKKGAEKYLKNREGSKIIAKKTELRNLVQSGGTGNEFIYAPKKSAKSEVATKKDNQISKTEEYLKKQMGDTFDVVKPEGNLWKSKGNTLFISPKRENAGYLNSLRQKNFIKSAQEAGNNIYKVEVNISKDLPKTGTIGASIGRFREEGDIAKAKSNIKEFDKEVKVSKTKKVFYRGEGGNNNAQGKALLAEGKHFASDSEYPKGFGNVSAYTIKENKNILDLGNSTFEEISDKLKIEKRKYISPKELSLIAKEKGYDILKYEGVYKSNGKKFEHIVDLTGNSLEKISSKKKESEPKKKKESTKKLPKSGIKGASIGRFREEGDIRLGNYEQIKPIEFPELLEFAKELSGSEVFIKKYKLANGKFYGKDGRIGLNPDLFKAGNLQQLQKTMAHEIGHLIDYLPEGTLSRGNTLGRLAVLRDFRKDFFAKAGVTRTNKEVTDQLWKLSKYWKPIDEATASPDFLAYRKSAPEIYADFISVLFNNPQLAGELAPTAYNIFFEQLDAKPKVKEAYFELQDSLRNGEEILKARRDKVRNMFTTAEQRARDRQAQIELEQEMKQKSAWFRFKFQFVSRIESFRDLVKQAEKEGKIVTDDDNPVYYLEESNYLGGKIKSIVDEKFNTIYQELQKNGMSWDDLGEIMFYERILKGDRQEVANPEGIQIDFIRDLYDGLNEGVQADTTTGTKGSQSLKTQLGDDNFAKLQSLAQEYRTAVKDLYREAYKEGLFKKETMDMIEANDYYVPFKPIKYAGTRTNYRIKNKKGTLHQIENPANTGIEKTIDLIKAIERNKVNTKAIEFLQKNFPKELQEAQYAFNGKARIALEPKDKDLKLVSFMKDGKQQSFYVDQYIGEALQKSPVAQSNMIMSGLRFLNSGLFRPLFITFNLGFQSFNFIRDAMRFWKNVPDMTLIKTLKLYSKSYTASKVRAFGLSENPTPKEQKAYDLVNKLERQKILSITYNDIVKGGSVEDSQIERIMQGVGVHEAKPTKLGTLASKVGVTRNTPIIKQAFQIMEFIEKTGNLIETLPKIAGYYAVEGKFPAKEMGSFIRRKIGSPDFLDGGKFKPVINEVFLFSNAIFQGIRSDFEVATEPKTRSGYWWKTMQATILPKLLMFLASIGVFGAYIKKMFDKVSEYDKTNYTIVPLGIDQNDKAIYFRMPQDQTGQVIGGLFWKIAQSVQDPKKLAELGTYTDFLSYAGGQAPSISPSITALYATQTFLAGENPYDFFRNRPVLTTEQMQAGGKYKTKPFLAYMFDNLGGGVFTKLYSNDTVPKNPSLGEKAVALPVVSNIAGRFIKFSNYGETEKLREITGEIKTTKARENIENRKVIFNAVDSAKGKPYGEAQAIKKQMILDLFGGKLPTTKEDRIKMRTFEKRFDTLRIRGTADAKVDALITAQSNDEKVALLKEYKSTMTDKEFTDLRNFIIKNKVVSSDAFQQFVREQK